MTITITLDHYDIIGTDKENMITLAEMLQNFAKSTKSIKIQQKDLPEKKSVEIQNSAEENPQKSKILTDSVEEKKLAKTSTERIEIENEIKRIAMNGKEKGVTKKIKGMLDEYGVEKLTDVPDEKLNDLLTKVKAL